MNANINSVVVTLSDGNTKKIEVKDGMVLILMGNGPMDGAFYKKLEDCSDADFNAAKEAEVTAEDFTPKPWSADFDGDAQPVQPPIENNKVENTNFNPAAYKVDNNSFDKAVDFLAHCKGEDFLELVRYAKAHGNTFFRCVSEVADCVNADDAYCSALIQLARPLGAEVEHRAFQLFEVAEESELCEENFLDFWKALQTISYFCG